MFPDGQAHYIRAALKSRNDNFDYRCPADLGNVSVSIPRWVAGILSFGFIVFSYSVAFIIINQIVSSDKKQPLYSSTAAISMIGNQQNRPRPGRI